MCGRGGEAVGQGLGEIKIAETELGALASAASRCSVTSVRECPAHPIKTRPVSTSGRWTAAAKLWQGAADWDAVILSGFEVPIAPG